jgi:hypothetical protein
MNSYFEVKFEQPARQASGGLLMLLVALELLTGKAAEPAELERVKANVAFVPLGVADRDRGAAALGHRRAVDHRRGPHPDQAGLRRINRVATRKAGRHGSAH